MAYWIKSEMKLRDWDRDKMKMRIQERYWLEDDQGNKKPLKDTTGTYDIGVVTIQMLTDHMTTERENYKFEIENFSEFDDFWGQEFETDVTLPGGG